MNQSRGTKALELWCRRQIEGYPGVQIHNMTTSWKNGLAFCALVHHFRPDLIDFDKLNKTNVYYNNDLAFRTAETHLGIPALLDAADMAKYEVPDRLSILTYLSQYYQRFAIREPKSPDSEKKGASIAAATTPPPKDKAAKDETDAKKSVSTSKPKVDQVKSNESDKSSGAENIIVAQATDAATTVTVADNKKSEIITKKDNNQTDDEKVNQELNDEANAGEKPMAPVAGVPKPKPCQKCGNAVFLAERLTIGNILYHRTCLRCARCDSQLSPGSFYETEVDGVFCCESCPDEERALANGRDVVDKASMEVIGVERQSFREKLAMFQTDGKGLLQKSLSDEEKSKSLKRLNDFLTKRDEEQGDTASSSTVLPELSTESTGKQEAIVESDTETTSTSDSEDEDDAPPLPKSEPPPLDDDQDASHVVHEKPQLPIKPASLLTKLNSHSALIESMLKNVEITSKYELSNNDTPASSDKSHIILSEETASLSNKTDMQSDVLDKQENVTKDDNNQQQMNEKLNAQVDASNAVTYRSPTNMVRSRLSQFEALVDTEPKHQSANCTSKSAGCDKNSLGSIDATVPVALDSAVNYENTNAMTHNDNETSAVNVELQTKSIHSPNNVNVPTAEQIIENNEHSDLVSDVSRHNNDSYIIEESNLSYHKKLEVSATTDTTNIMDNGQSNGIGEDSLDSNGYRPVPQKRVTKETGIRSSTLPPTPSKRKTKENNEESDETRLETAAMSSLPAVEVHFDQTNTGEPSDVEQSNKANEENDPKYPVSLNPFGSDDEDETLQLRAESPSNVVIRNKIDTSNPFDSSDDEIELLKREPKSKATTNKRITNFRVSTNPFGSDDEDDDEITETSSRRTPVPSPRRALGGSLQSTPEPSPRMTRTLNPRSHLVRHADLYGSNTSLYSSRGNQLHGSINSLASSMTPSRRKKGRAPAIPLAMADTLSVSEMSPMKSASVSPSHSIRSTPLSKKKRQAPIPPPGMLSASSTISVAEDSQLEDSYLSIISNPNESLPNMTVDADSSSALGSSLNSGVLTSEDTITESTTTEETSNNVSVISKHDNEDDLNVHHDSPPQRKLISLEPGLLDDYRPSIESPQSDSTDIVYRRVIIPQQIPDDTTPFKENDFASSNDQPSERQCEKLKENKESQNKTRQSQGQTVPLHSASTDVEALYGANKSAYGKWKRRKGPAPALPVPPRKVLQMLPLQDIRHELDIIEVQQQGLEKQGVILEKMIRDRCEGDEDEHTPITEFKPNSKEVEDLILQLFELVNEKNELFRRQAELMYLRRQHRLEQEQADIEYEIRVLMAQPECNKTDTDKSREETLISRLVEIVQLRNDVIESLEMDRLREAEEDQSIKERLELHTAKCGEQYIDQATTKLSKKEKKKQKEAKKLAKQKKVDADKDADESEIQLDNVKEKKKKKKFLII